MIHLSFTNSLTFPFPSKMFWYSATRENTSAITSMMPKSQVQGQTCLQAETISCASRLTLMTYYLNNVSLISRFTELLFCEIVLPSSF